MADTKTVFYGTGRRKKSIARVRLVEGNGTITVNGRDLNEYFGADTLKYIVKQPLSVTETSSKYLVIFAMLCLSFIEHCLLFVRVYATVLGISFTAR